VNTGPAAGGTASAPPARVAPYPLLLQPILFEKVWGGLRLERFGKTLPPEKLIGESWEVADLGRTSASGAGGGEQRSVIADGPLAGRTLHDAVRLWKDDLVARDRLTAAADFPLLVKLLDARENLSVQVHPSPAYAAAHPEAHVKEECWYILQAEPGSVIYTGVKPGLTADAIGNRLDQGALADDLIATPVAPGEMYTLPSGTVHALGAGVVVAEIQTASDTTFRLFDWNRRGRELHVEQALECMDLSALPTPPTCLPPASAGSPIRLATTTRFSVDGLRLAPGQESAIAAFPACVVLTIVQGAATLRAGANAVRVESGRAAVVPASIASSATIRCDAAMTALITTL
jgi:mannose-6-phosphate isomerase